MGKSKHAPALFELIDRAANPKEASKLDVPKWFKSPEHEASSQPGSNQQTGQAGPASSQSAKPAPAPTVPASPQAGGPSSSQAGGTSSPQAGSPSSPQGGAPASGLAGASSTTSATAAVSSPAPPVRPKTPGQYASSAGSVLADQRPPVVRIRDGRVELSLTPVNAAIASLVVLLALFTSYLLGQNMGSGTAADRNVADGASDGDRIAEALNQPPDADVLDLQEGTLIQKRNVRGATPPNVSRANVEPKVDPSARAADPGETADRAADPASSSINYVVIQSFKKDDRDAAKHVQKWLAEVYGLDTQLDRSGDWWRLSTAKGFDFARPGHKEACAQFIAEIQSLGSACAKELTRHGLSVYTLSEPFAARLDR